MKTLPMTSRHVYDLTVSKKYDEILYDNTNYHSMLLEAQMMVNASVLKYEFITV